MNLNIERDEVGQMQECEEYLHQEMTRLLQEMQGSSGTMEALLPSALQQQWLLWASAAALLLALLSVHCCWSGEGSAALPAAGSRREPREGRLSAARRR